MQTTFQAFSLSHINAPLEVRERLSLTEDEAKAFMVKAKEFFDITDLLVVSTCNRTEGYVNSSSDIKEELVKLLLISKGIVEPTEYLPYFEFFESPNEAARHLFEVATGLHSQVIGDMQIPNQIKKSYQWSADLNLAGPYMHRLLHTIFFANKRVALETSFRDGAASTSYVAAELAASVSSTPKVLVVGLGEIGEDVCRNISAHEGVDLTITNRTQSKAEKLAGELGCKMAPFENLVEELKKADVIISSVQMSEPLFTKQLVQELNLLTFKYFVDLSVPRSVEKDIDTIPGVILYDVDTIKSRADQALEKRLASVPQVKSIIDQSLMDFSDWSRDMVVSPTINRFKNALEQIRQEELSRYMRGLNDSEMAIVDKVTSSMMQKIIKLPVLQLKAACKRGEAETLIDVLNDLFNLEAVSETKR